MSKNRIFTIGLAALLTAGLMSSCSQEVATEAQETQETARKVTVKELTERLRDYNASVYGLTRDTRAWGGTTQVDATKKKMGIVLADVSGAYAGAYFGGWIGAVTGAALFSLADIIDKKYFPNMLVTREPVIYLWGNVAVASDSTGFYHNMLEVSLYDQKGAAVIDKPMDMLTDVDNIMRRKSAGYAAAGGLSNNVMKAITDEFDDFRTIDSDSLSFDDYCDVLIARNPERADYINFVGEYLFAVFYGNVDVDEYTGEVMFMISHSNAGVEDANLLNICIQVAYASSILPLGTKTL